jgi:hypothetical protein
VRIISRAERQFEVATKGAVPAFLSFTDPGPPADTVRAAKPSALIVGLRMEWRNTTTPNVNTTATVATIVVNPMARCLGKEVLPYSAGTGADQRARSRCVLSNKCVHLHFTPTSASWLNQVERFFGLITQDAIRRGVFRSVTELKTAMEAYLENHNADPKPFIWTAKAADILEKVARGRRVLC